MQAPVAEIGVWRVEGRYRSLGFGDVVEPVCWRESEVCPGGEGREWHSRLRSGRAAAEGFGWRESQVLSGANLWDADVVHCLCCRWFWMVGVPDK